jgi:hypothetical protein
VDEANLKIFCDEVIDREQRCMDMFRSVCKEGVESEEVPVSA